MGAGIILYAPAIVLSVILGWDERITISVMAVVTVIYTMIGGITAVIWTDVIQMLMVFAGIAVALAALFANLPAGVGVADVVYVGGIQEMWRTVDLSWDPTNTYTLWSGLLGGFFLFLAYFGTDQSQVQRYLTASSLKDSRLSLIFNAFLKVPMQLLILSIGVLLFVFYHFERPPLVFSPAEVTAVEESPRRDELRSLQEEQTRVHRERMEATMGLLEARHGEGAGGEVEVWRSRIEGYDRELAGIRRDAKVLVEEVRGMASNDVNYVFPTYIIRYIPTGILGILIAVIFAAAMSSLDSEITALSSATVMDFYQRWFRPEATEAHYLLVSRLATLFWGLFAFGVALYAGQLGSLIEAVNQVGSFFYGSLLGVFLLAFFLPRANGTGAFFGLLAGMASVFVVSLTTEISWLYYNVVGAGVVVAVGLLLSRPGPSPDRAPRSPYTRGG
jgi:Na+/proline symporter